LPEPEDGGRRFAVAPERAASLSFPLPTLEDDVAYGVEAATLAEADMVRVHRRLDRVDQRLGLLRRVRESARNPGR
jgi:hypothetical protein